jgi:hypothetical protein
VVAITSGAALLAASAVAGCTPSPSDAVADATPAATEAPEPLPLEDAALEPGRYVASVVDGRTYSVLPVLTVPDGFSSFDQGSAVADWGSDITDARVVWMWDVVNAYTHPCEAGAYAQPVGPSVADLATALAAQPLRDGAEPVPVSLGGYDGLYLELTVPDGTDIAACPFGRFSLWEGRWQQSPGQVNKLWILDVDGDRLVVDAAHGPDVSPEAVQEMDDMVDGITFTAVRPPGTPSRGERTP